VRLTNADTTLLSATAQLQVLLQAPAPRIVSISRNNPAVTVTFTTAVGAVYRLEFKDSLFNPDWTFIGTQTGTGAPASILDPVSAGPTRFYRVRVD
jgi:hypothetical protein